VGRARARPTLHTMFFWLAVGALVFVGFKFPVFSRTVIVPMSFGVPIGSITWSVLIQNNDELFSLRGYSSVVVGFVVLFMIITAIAETNRKDV
jgi:uncharacterized membrane protein YphA (DoxX/SURF4 family)